MASAPPITVIKAADLPKPQPVSEFLIGRAQVDTGWHFNMLEYYANTVPDAEFKSFFREKLNALNAQVGSHLAVDKV